MEDAPVAALGAAEAARRKRNRNGIGLVSKWLRILLVKKELETD